MDHPNLIEPEAMGADDLDKFQSNLRSVLGFIKYSDNGEELDMFLSKECGLEALEVEAARVIKVCARTEIEIDEDAEVINMCKAERELREKARQEGRKEGSEKARLETLCAAVKNVMDSFKVSIQDAMNALKIGKEDQEVMMKMI